MTQQVKLRTGEPFHGVIHARENIMMMMILMMTMMNMIIQWEYNGNDLDGDEREDMSQQKVGDNNKKPGEAANW